MLACLLQVLQSTLLRLAAEHPFHTLYQLLALTRAGPMKAPTRNDAHGGVLAHSVDRNRLAAAQHLLDCYGKLGDKQAKIKEQVRRGVRGLAQTFKDKEEGKNKPHTSNVT